MQIAPCWKCDGDHLAFHCREWPGALHPPDRIPPHKRMQATLRATQAEQKALPTPQPAPVALPEEDIRKAALIIVADVTATIPASYASAIDGARLPANYEQAKAALAEVERIDQCREWANQYEALASYARQARDDVLFANAQRIRDWAIRRMGELLRQIPVSHGGRPSTKTYDTGGIGFSERRRAASDAGISRKQQSRAERVAALPIDEFKKAVERPKPATVIELSRRSPRQRPAAAKPSRLIAFLERVSTEAAALDVNVEFDELDEAGKERAGEALAAVEAWIGRASLLIRGG